MTSRLLRALRSACRDAEVDGLEIVVSEQLDASRSS